VTILSAAIIAAGALAATGFATWRRAHVAALTRLTLEHRELGPDGVVIGGEGFILERPDAPAVLLLHGAGDTPQTLRYVADALFDAGFHVAVPLLPGHGVDVAEFGRTTADAWAGAAANHYAALRASHDWVGIVGLSMGGALAVPVAAAHPDLPALALVAPYLAMPRKIERAAALAWAWGPFVPLFRSGEGVSILDPDERARSLAYGVFTPRALAALRETVRRARAALPRVTVPTLVIQSRQDNRISATDAERAFRQLGTTERRLEWISGAAHVITVDYGRERVIALLTSWMRSHLVSS